MYKMKAFILLVNIVSLLDFNNKALGGPTVCGAAHWTLSPAHFLLSKQINLLKVIFVWVTMGYCNSYNICPL